MTRLILGTFLLAHGAVHLLYLMPAPSGDKAWPFLVDGSWLVPAAWRRPAAIVSAVAIALIYLIAALAVWAPGFRPALPAVLLMGSILSLLLFVAYWHRWLSIGVVIALTLLIVAVTDPLWWRRIVS